MTYEYQACKQTPDGIEKCSDAEATFYGVYERMEIDGANLAHWRADFARKYDAAFCVDALNQRETFTKEKS